jgi:uncharacterized membrane protein YbhN (UPF0104 family)/membrane-associated phospholipid phosphatase
MSWIRAEEEERERRPGDVARCVVGVFGVALSGLWAGAHSGVEANAVRLLNDLPEGLEGFAKAVYALGSIWAVVAVVLLVLALRKWVVALSTLLAGVLAWGIAELIHQIAGPQALHGLTISVRTGTGPEFPARNVAVVTALALVLTPYLVRFVRWIFLALIILIAISTVYLGAALLSDVAGAVFLGLASAGATLVVFGAPGGRPTKDEVAGALHDLGFGVERVEPIFDGPARAGAFNVTLKSSDQLRVFAFGRDQRDSQLAAKCWRWLMYREPGVPLFGSRLQQVEHIAYGMILASEAGVTVPKVTKTGVAGPGAMLVTTVPAGRLLADLPADSITDSSLQQVWHEAHVLHEAGISHGQLDTHHIVVDHSTVALDDFTSVDTTANAFWRNRDSATLLISTSLLVGNDRAISAATCGLGKERVGALIPMVQPASLPPGSARGTRHLSKQLKALRADLSTATGAEDAPPLKIQRLSLMNIGMLLGVLIALALLIPTLTHINYASVQKEFENADWAWIAVAALLYPLIPMAWGTALIGAVNSDLPFVPTALTQLAATFLNLVTPNGIGGTALQIDYLHRRDIPVASATSSYVLSTGVGGIVQTILLIIAASLTSTNLDLKANAGSIGLWAVAIVAAVIGVVLLIPKIRGKVVPAVVRAARDIWAVLRNPRKAAQLVGGDLAGNLVYPALLGLCLLAFHQHLGFAELVVVQIGAGILGSVAPVPGGIGVQEAALTAGLTSFGVASSPALAAVLVFRGITFFLPPIFGFFTLRWMRAKGLV